MLQLGLVDEAWYLAHHPDVADAVRAGHFRSGEHHYVMHGILEGRPPREPKVDEAWYLAAYPDVAAAVHDGRFASAYEHYMREGWREARRPARS